MALHTFVPGEIARSADVNDSFAYIMSILGPLSSPTRVKTTTEFLMGARKNTLLTGTADTGVADASGVRHDYFQLGWNADYNLSGGTWKFARFIDGKGAAVFRLGDGEFYLMGTHENTAGINASMTTYMHIKHQASGSYVYMPNTFSFTNKDSTPNSVDDYRLMYTPLSSPQAIFDAQAVKAGSRDKAAKNYGVPTAAKLINVTVTCIAASSSTEARVRVLQNSASTSIRQGFTVAAGQGRHGAGYGTVPLGVTSGNIGEITIVTTQDFSSLTVVVTGYWV